MQTPTIQFPLQWGEFHFTIQPKVLTLSVRNEVLPLLQEYSATSTEEDMMAIISNYPILATFMSKVQSNSEETISNSAITELLAEHPTLFRLLKNPPLPLVQDERRINIAIELIRKTVDASQCSQEMNEAINSGNEHQFWQQFPLEILEQYLEFFRQRFLPS